MDKRVYITAAIIFIIALLGLLGYNYFEIYEYKEPVYGSREVLSNNYYAMENWLKETGINVSVENELYTEQLAEKTEKVIIAHSRSLFTDDASEISRWIEQGGFFVLAIDYYSDDLNESIITFLSDLGISYNFAQRPITAASPEKADEDSEKKIYLPPYKTGNNIKPARPDFQNRIVFELDNEDEFFLIRDTAGNIRLAEIIIGNGALTVTGLPVYMTNQNIERDVNAVLSWRLTGARLSAENTGKEKGILFVRPSNKYASGSLFETIMERGNLVPVIISAILLIFTGFWMVVPLFGLVPEDKQRISRPLKDRFKAEIRFLKKYHALNYYLKAYKSGQNSEMEKTYNYRDLINHYRRLIDGTAKT